MHAWIIARRRRKQDLVPHLDHSSRSGWVAVQCVKEKNKRGDYLAPSKHSISCSLLTIGIAPSKISSLLMCSSSPGALGIT